MTKTSQKPYMSQQAMYFWPKNGQNSHDKNFPNHNIVIRCFKAITPSFWPSFRQIWGAVSKKMCKNLIFEQKWPNFGPKRVQKWPPFFCQNKNFHWPLLNNKFSLNNINYQKNINGLEKNGQNSLKPYNVTTSNVFLSQKWPKQEFS